MASGKIVNAPTWNTSNAGFTWTRFPNGFIWGYKREKITSGTVKDSLLYTNSYAGEKELSISDIPFKTDAIGLGDVLASYTKNLKLEVGITWNKSAARVTLFADQPNIEWQCRIVVMGF